MELFKSKNYIDDGKSIGIFYDDNHKCERHHHEFIEIVYVKKGRAKQIVDDDFYEVERGDLVFINYGSNHSFESEEGFEFYNISLNPEFLSSVLTKENASSLLLLTAFDEMRQDKSAGKISFSGDDKRDVEYLLEKMLKENQTKSDGYASIMESCLNIILTLTLRRSGLPIIVDETDKWQRLLEYICNNPEEKLTLEALSRRCFYNPSYFSRVFKQKVGVSVSEYVRENRLSYARRLLLETDASIEDIIEKSGYSDRSSFYHAFQKAYSCTPNEMRGKVK